MIRFRALLLALLAGCGLLVAACSMPPYHPSPDEPPGPIHGESGGDGGGGGSM
jgi:hypothetical protein